MRKDAVFPDDVSQLSFGSLGDSHEAAIRKRLDAMIIFVKLQ
jgi:hypothetical protein